jgi:3',5'-cyclic AMP phosphodiesterase CpdA
MKFVHFGDLHVWSRSFVWRELQYPKRWIGPVNLRLNRRKRFPPGYRLPAISAVINEKPDVAVFTGDFTTFSLREEFVMASALFERIFEKVGDGLIALPGNHDRYTEAAVRKGHLEDYLAFLPKERVFTKQLAPRITVVGVDHAYPFLLRSNGIVKDDVHEQLVETLERMKRTNQIVILAGHFPFITPPEHPESWNHKLLGEEKMLEVVRTYKPWMYLHGHKHVRWSLRDDRCPDTLCLNCGSIGMRSDSREKQAGYITWDMDERGEIWNLTAKVFDGRSEWVPHALPAD